MISEWRIWVGLAGLVLLPVNFWTTSYILHVLPEEHWAIIPTMLTATFVLLISYVAMKTPSQKEGDHEGD